MPLFWDMPLGKSIDNTGQNDKWKNYTGGVKNLFTINDYHFYYDILSNLFSSVDIWITHYMHVMDSHESILDMIRGTGLKPYLEKLETEENKSDFTLEIFESIKKDYHLQNNGKVIFPFKRLFFIAGNVLTGNNN